MKMIKWKKPNGQAVETNDLPANIEKAVELGWERNKAKKKAKK